MLNLGDKVKCKITGMTGIIIAKTSYLYGKDTIGINPGLDKDGDQRDVLWYTDDQLQRAGKKSAVAVVDGTEDEEETTDVEEKAEESDDSDSDSDFAPKKKAKKKAAAFEDEEAVEEADDEDDAAEEEETEEEEEAPVKKKKAKKLTDQDVNDACKAASKRTSFEKVKALLLKKFKVKSVNQLEEEQYAEVIEAVGALKGK